MHVCLDSCVVFYDCVQSVSFTLVIKKKVVIKNKFLGGLDLKKDRKSKASIVGTILVTYTS
jgi:hypothetical protein